MSIWPLLLFGSFFPSLKLLSKDFVTLFIISKVEKSQLTDFHLFLTFFHLPVAAISPGKRSKTGGRISLSPRRRERHFDVWAA